MAISLNGMNRTSIQALTEAMLQSGITLDFSSISNRRQKAFDAAALAIKTSLIIAPLVCRPVALRPMLPDADLVTPRNSRQTRINTVLSR